MFEETEGELTYKDFLPECQKPKGFLTDSEYESFRSLVDRANEWLRFNPQWEIKTCESVEFNTKNDEMTPERMVYIEGRTYHIWYIRGLRLWLKGCSAEKNRVKQIGYKNILPEIKTPGGMMSADVYETLDEVVTRYNENSCKDPIPGRIITLETQNMKMYSGASLDADRSNWVESGRVTDTFVFIIRIFFEQTYPQYEEIGLTDFVPDLISKSCLNIRYKYEPFSKVVDKASQWCSQQKHLRICNLQSVASKLNESLTNMEADTRSMRYKEYGRAASFFIRIVRVAHVKRKEEDNIVPIPTCKIFPPVQLVSKRGSSILLTADTMPQFEGLSETIKRISAWMKATGAEVINMETTLMKYHQPGSEHSVDESFFYTPSDYWIYVIRAYLNGPYQEPAEGTLPAVPEIETEGCTTF